MTQPLTKSHSLRFAKLKARTSKFLGLNRTRIQESITGLHLFSLYEIRSLVSCYLRQSDVFNCLLVCRTWNSWFISDLYYRFDILIEIEYDRIPDLKTLNKYAHSIRELRFGYGNLNYYSIQSTMLTRLDISGERMIIGQFPQNSSPAIDLIKRNKNTLKYFSLYQTPILSSTTLWNALAGCNLNSLEVARLAIPLDDSRAFWEACTKTRKLLMDCVTFHLSHSSLRTILPAEGFPNLRELSMSILEGFNGECQLEIADRAPNVNVLNLEPNLRHVFPVDNYRRLMSMKVFISLHSLTLRHPGLDDGDIATTLTAMTEARKFHVSSSKFLGNSYRALMANHAMTIQHLDFWNCTTITSTMVQGILTGCPSLESLQAKAILGTDLVRIVDDDPKDPTAPERLILGKDWVCLKLKRLVVHFDLSSTGAHIDQSTPEGKTRFKRQQELEQYHAFRQVSRLTELEALDFRGDATISQGKKCLNLKLRSRGGELEQLESLKKLSHIEFYSTEQDMTEEEIDWMLEHWPKLTIFEGEPQKDRALCQKLINYANVGLKLRAKRRYDVFMSYCSWSNTVKT